MSELTLAMAEKRGAISVSGASDWGHRLWRRYGGTRLSLCRSGCYRSCHVTSPGERIYGVYKNGIWGKAPAHPF
jgi:hypothetical protein